MMIARSARASLGFVLALLFSVACLPAARADDAPVTIKSAPDAYTLSNGILTAKVNRHTGNLASLKYNGIETLNGGSHDSGFWSHSAAGGESISDQVTIDPASNGGERGEVSVKGICGGRKMGSGSPGGGAIADIEIRYCLARGDSALYTYCIWTHQPSYPASDVGEARFCAKLNDAVFDWMTVDARRNMEMITAYDWDHGTTMNMKEARRMNTGIYKGQVEHKYDYSANQFDTLAWGWSSSAKHIGIWFINPTIEYLSGGPTKFELSAHRDATFTSSLTAPAPPCLLDYWRSSHYGGSVLDLDRGEQWTRVIGPFLIYCNQGDHNDAWHDALRRSKIETAAWPYGWVNGVDYPHRDQRATVTGKIELSDPQAPAQKLSHLLVGLTSPDYTAQSARGTIHVTWQIDAKHYQFWTRGNDDGAFSIPNVRPGDYTLRALSDGVLGEFAQANVTVRPGQTLDLGSLRWEPKRFGEQLWQIGIPNRTGSEYLDGDNYFHWGMYLKYARLFPHDVDFTIGKSDFGKDWYFEQVPHAFDDSGNGRSAGHATPWTIHFDLPRPPHGKAILRLAICGIGTRSIDVSVNGKPAGTVDGLVYNATINRDGIGGTWEERDLEFDAGLMNAGANVLTLTVPPGPLPNGIIYDCLRLEVEK